MKRVMILCEGQAEEQFVKRILSPYFIPQNKMEEVADQKWR